MNINHLQYIVMIAQERNITKAAEKLYISQSSLSYTLSAVEKEIGQPLFFRQKQGVVITPAGEKYVEAAKKILRIHDETMRELRAMQKSTNIRLASASIWGSKFIEEIVPKFHKKHPEAFFDITAQVELYYLDSEIQKGNLDFALISLSPFDHLDSNMQILREEPLFLTVPVSHPYCQRNPGDVMPLDDIPQYFKDDVFLISRLGSSIRTAVDHVFESLSFTPKRIFEVNGLYLTIGMVAEEEGPAFIPLSTVCENPKIHYYRTDPVLYRYNVLVSKPLNNCNETEQTFYRYVLSYLKNQREERNR
ncbi:MAG: LysR family transcriptional regulator [Oliverpabstia intestinalis]|nr:LysR family transcriptional regulator [Oliverpabstia intestinalis]MDD6411176.1 LysR family transcriptional regulator [Oliverpabstia intestinalis]